MPAIPDFVRVDLVRKLIDLSKGDPNSFFKPLDVSRVKYVPPKEYDCGKWVLDDSAEPLQVTIVGEIGPKSQIGPYAEAFYEHDNPKPIDARKVAKIKGRFNILFPPTIELDYIGKDDYKRALKNCANNLNSIEVENESTHKRSYDDPDFTVNSFVRYSDVHEGAEASLASDALFLKAKGGKKKVGFGAKKGLMFNDDGSGAQDNDTLANWSDPLGRYSAIPNPSEFAVNSSIQAFDHEGKIVHPRDWEKVFPPGTMVEAHCMPILWDLTNADACSRTYQLKILKIRALHAPPPVGDASISAVANVAKKRKASVETELKPPSDRPFKQINIGYDQPGTSGASPVASASDGQSTSTLDEAFGEDLPESVPPVKASKPKTKKAKADKDKLREKERDKEVVEQTMDFTEAD